MIQPAAYSPYVVYEVELRELVRTQCIYPSNFYSDKSVTAHVHIF